MKLTVINSNGTCFTDGSEFILTTDDYGQLGIIDDDCFYQLEDIVEDGVEFTVTQI